MISLNINNDTAVQLIVGVGATILALLLMLIRLPKSDHIVKLANAKHGMIVSFLICSFTMFFTISKYDEDFIWDWSMFTMLMIYIVVHFSTSIISYSMIALLNSNKQKRHTYFKPGLFVSAILSIFLLESYRSGNIGYFIQICVIALTAFLIQSITYIVYFHRAYRQSVKDLENYYDEEDGHKIRWVRFCYIIAMLTNLFFLVYLLMY